MRDSRISGLYKQSINERIELLEQRGWLSRADAEMLRQGRHVVSARSADSMVENVIGIFGLPLAIAPNFIVNQRAYIVPMVVEEPSVVAALSNAARLARGSGGFEALCDESMLAGQIILTKVPDPDQAEAALREQRQALIAAGNAVHPRLVERGGGVRDLEIRRLDATGDPGVLAVHLLVDTGDAMGANLVNTICEVLAPRVAAICGGDVSLRILSNLADRSLAIARVRYSLASLAGHGDDAGKTRDGVVAASRIAAADPYRAATHNKGIMNGIDALAIATGNDWRAIEAGAHAYAAASGRYRPLANWSVADDGALVGEIRVPLKVGIVGGTLATNPAAALSLRLTAVESARELAGLMAAVGLAQNFAALQALATTGIQEGHMRLHARSVAARSSRRPETARPDPVLPGAAGKVILLGEHAAVYGRHALALPLAHAAAADIRRTSGETTICVPRWDIRGVPIGAAQPLDGLVRCVLNELDAADTGFVIEVQTSLPRGMGLGSSAAIAVALIRGFCRLFDQALDDERVNAIAFECEKLAHGTPSGVDNTIATYGTPMLFRKDATLHIERLVLSEQPPLVIACSNQPGSTTAQVAGVRERRDRMPIRYDALFDEIDALALAGVAALNGSDFDELGRLLNLCHGLLNAIEVSTAELEAMVQIARAAGAAGAKLTGSGGGGSIVAVCPDSVETVRIALESAGFRTLLP